MAPTGNGIWKTAPAVFAACVGMLVIFSSCSGGEPNATVSGTVTDAVTGLPIQGASVSDDGFGAPPYRGATTDAAGIYQYTTWSEEHGVVAQASGYSPRRQGLTTGVLQTQKKQVLDFALTRE